MRLLFLFLGFFCVAPLAHGAVVINEVAWMGTEVSANDEWIELHNEGATAVLLEGWYITDGMNFDVPLTGSLPAGAYGVIERTDDASAPGAAFMVYTGALTNTGATLSLYNANGSLVDRVVGGENWENIGGDNTTKETAQYTTSGWITAAGTPGAVNSISATENEGSVDSEASETAEEATSEDKDEGGTVTKRLHHTPRELGVDIVSKRQVYVNQAAEFSAAATGLADGILNSLTHQWNFGDTHTATGSSVVHRYAYPGEYVVTLYGHYGTYEAATRQRVVVLPTTFSLALTDVGDVQVHNDARYEIDISGYRLGHHDTFVFPPRSLMLPGATITVPRTLYSAAQGQVVLRDESGAVVAAYAAPQQAVTQTAAAPLAPVAVVSDSTSDSDAFNFAAEAVEQITPKKAAAAELPVVAPATAIEAAPAGWEDWWPFLALFGLIGLALVAVFATRVES